jgi:hypothetical protein
MLISICCASAVALPQQAPASARAAASKCHVYVHPLLRRVLPALHLLSKRQLLQALQHDDATRYKTICKASQGLHACSHHSIKHNVLHLSHLLHFLSKHPLSKGVLSAAKAAASTCHGVVHSR